MGWLQSRSRRVRGRLNRKEGSGPQGSFERVVFPEKGFDTCDKIQNPSESTYIGILVTRD